MMDLMESSDDYSQVGMHDDNLRIMELLRAFAADYTYLIRHLSTWLGVHTADAAAYAEILYAQDKGAPLTPAQLARRISLSSGATTTLLNRLEAANLVVRSREQRDRRVVTLRSAPAVHREAPLFFGPLAARMDAAMSQQDSDFRARVVHFLGDVHDTMTSFIDEIDGLVPPRSTPPRDG